MESIDLNMEDIFDDQDADVNDLDDDFPTASRVLPDLPPEGDGDDQDAENTEVLSRLRDMSKGAGKARVLRPQPKLDAVRLTGERGLIILPKIFRDVKFKGKGHEVDDLRTVMTKYEHWAHRLFPKMTFDEVIERAERLGKKSQIQVHVKRLRLDMPLEPTSEDVQGGDEEEDGQTANRSRTELDDDMDAEDAFDAIMREDNEDDDTHQNNRNHVQSPPATSQPVTSQPSTSQPASQRPTGLTEEQLERIERNKRLAQERRAAKLGLTTPTPVTGEPMANNPVTLPGVQHSQTDTKIQEDKSAAQNMDSEQPSEPIQPPSLNQLFPNSTGAWECTTCLVQNKTDVNDCIACSTTKPIAGKMDKTREILNTEVNIKSSTTTLSDLFQKPVGSWNCDVCMVQNTADCSKCVACGTPNSSSNAEQDKTTAMPTDAAVGGDSSIPSLSSLFSKPAGSWDCEVCMVQNKSELSKCVACGTANSSSGAAISQTNTTGKVITPSTESAPSLSALFSKPAGSWNCDVCMVENKPNCSKCVACGTVNTSKNATTDTNALEKDQISKDSSAPSLSSLFSKPAGTWSCDVCMVGNKAESSECVACGAANPSGGATKTTNFGKPTGGWDCDTCLLQNTATASKCVACSVPKPGAVAAGGMVIAEGALSTGKGFQINPPTTSSTAGGFKFGSSAPAPSTDGGFKFGSSSESTTKSSSAGGFSFGSSSVPPTTTGGFKFGSLNDATLSGSATAGFSFGSSTDKAAKPDTTSSGFRFGSSTDAPALSSTGTDEHLQSEALLSSGEPRSLPPSSGIKVQQESAANMNLETEDRTETNNRNNNNDIHEDLPPTPETLPPVDDTLVPVNGVVTDPDETVPAIDETLPPTNETIPPVNGTQVFVDETLPPADETLPPADETLPPADETLPHADETLPPGEETVPPANESFPSGDETLSPLRFYEDSEEQTSTQQRDEAMDIAD